MSGKACDEICMDHLTFDLNITAFLELEWLVVDEFVHVLWDVNAHWHAVVLHHCSHRDGRAEDVECGLLNTEDTGGDRATAVDAGTNTKGLVVLYVEELKGGDGLKAEADSLFAVLGWLVDLVENTAGSHVAVTDALDLDHTVVLGEALVEDSKHLVQCLHDDGGREGAAPWCETDDVHEEDGGRLD